MKTAKCTECNQDFPSRNQLFKHLEDSGHGASLSAGNEKDNDSSHHKVQEVDATDGISSSSNNDISKPQLSKGNNAYYEYYLRQKIFNSYEDGVAKNEQAWKEAYHRLRTPLPISYRIHESNAISGFSVQLLELVEKVEEGSISASRCGNSALEEETTTVEEKKQKMFQKWSFNTENEEDCDSTIPKLRMTITPQVHHRNKSSSNRKGKEDKKSDVYSPILHALQELGSIHRQELVSAIPPLVLWAAGSKEKGDTNNDAIIIADLCAAPGSKSLQLLDMLYTNNIMSMSSDANNNDINIPSGLLVVNDSDRNRIITLCQRSRHVPRAPMLSINMDARYFPGIRRKCNWNGGKVVESATTGEDADTDAVVVAKNNVKGDKAGYKQKYDKVLCDVPCSGDGTTRKNKQVWNTWSIAHAMSLHRLQRKILRRAMELLRPGGIVVYSTCSLNPLEDEAVVASVIGDIVGGVDAMEIVPLPDWLVQKCGVLRGLTTWEVPNPKFGKNGIISDMYSSFDDVPTEHQGGEGGKGKGKKKGGQINRSMFPPPEKDSGLSKQLRHCGRFVPSVDFDSGGFFVACIRRLQVGELVGVKDKDQSSQKNVAEASNEKMAVTEEEEPTQEIPTAKNDDDNLNEEAGDPKRASSANVSLATTEGSDQCLREGDWICPSCKELNFGRRNGSRCFKAGCKARKPYSLQQKGNKDQDNYKIQRPLLIPPSESSVLESFFEFFGIPQGPESLFPLDNTRLICRAREHVIVVVSESLSKLAISENWNPVRELGISLAAFPSPSEIQVEASHNHEFRLFDEGLPILTKCATRRHFKLQPVQFQNVLAQSVRLLLASSPGAEAERVKATHDRSSGVAVDSVMWYDSLQDDSMTSMWALCKSSPGVFIVSCECKIPISEGGSTGCFSLSGCIDADGIVSVKTSLRVAAAMLVVVHKYLEVLNSSSDPPIVKRRRI